MAEGGGGDAEVPSWQIDGTAGMKPWQLWGMFQARCISFKERMTIAELSGSLGDLGTLIPLLASSAQVGSIRMGPAIFWMGIFNVISAFQWDIPMPVQPMKSISAVAINDGFEPGAFAAAGIICGVITWILGVTQFIDAVNKFVPGSLIAGMQLGLGLRMASKGFAAWHLQDWLHIDGKITIIVCFLLTTTLLLRTRAPTALIIFLIGTVITILRMFDASVQVSFDFLKLSFLMPDGEEWLDGLLRGALPQLPLTCLNSCISVCALSVELFRDPSVGGKGCSRASVASSVGIMNALGCWFGGMPSCHGAGGLAGQYRFGARGGASIFILGSVKILLSLFLGETLDSFISFYPKTILGVLLVYAGIELASVGIKGVAKKKGSELEKDLIPCFVTAASYIGTKNMALGVVSGMMVAALQRTDEWKKMCPCLGGDKKQPLEESGEAAAGESK